MRKVLVTCPGRAGDLLWALPSARAIAEAVGSQVDLQIAGEFAPMVDLLLAQPYLDRVHAHPDWHMDHGWEPPQARRDDWISPDDQVIHLGYRRWPEKPLPQEVYDQALVDCALGGIRLDRRGLDLCDPWISVTQARPSTRVAVGWTDCWFELKFGVMELIFSQSVMDTSPRNRLLAPPGSRWVREGGYSSFTWLEAARVIAGAPVFLGDCSALHVLAVALGVPVVCYEPMEARWNPIFYPLGMDGPQVRVVKGLDGRPTIDARHTADTLREVLRAPQ